MDIQQIIKYMLFTMRNEPQVKEETISELYGSTEWIYTHRDLTTSHIVEYNSDTSFHHVNITIGPPINRDIN